MADTTFLTTADNRLEEDAATTANGADIYLEVGNGSGADAHRTILEFDASAFSYVVGAAKVRSRILALAAGADQCRAYKLINPGTGWVEAQSSYNNYKTGTAWPGGAGAFGDVDLAIYSDIVLLPIAGHIGIWWEITGLKDLVQDALDNEAGAVRLLIKSINEATGNHVDFYSKERDDGSSPAELVVTGSRIRTGRPNLRRSHYAARNEQRPGGWRPALAGLTNV
jgi:hypothetical protein